LHQKASENAICSGMSVILQCIYTELLNLRMKDIYFLLMHGYIPFWKWQI